MFSKEELELLKEYQDEMRQEERRGKIFAEANNYLYQSFSQPSNLAGDRVSNLKWAARQCGYTEDEINDTFGYRY